MNRIISSVKMSAESTNDIFFLLAYVPQDATVFSGECTQCRRSPKIQQKLHIRK